MKKIFNRLMCLFAAAALVSACNSNNNEGNDTITEQYINECFTYVADAVDGTRAYYDGMGFQLRLNFTKATANLLVHGLKLNDGTVYPDFTLADMPFRTDNDGWIEITAPTVTPSMSGFAAPTFTNVKVRLYQRIVNGIYVPAFTARFTVNQRSAVTVALKVQYFWGDTESTASTGSKFETTETSYALRFHADTRTVDITMSRSQFIGAMPALDIELKAVPFNIMGDKAYIEAASIIPYIGDTPYATYPISNLKAEVNFGGDFDMQFDCAPQNVPGSPYHVEADADVKPLE